MEPESREQRTGEGYDLMNKGRRFVHTQPLVAGIE